MPFKSWPSIALVGTDNALKQVAEIRKEDEQTIRIIEQTKLKGRQRTGVRAAAPTSHNDIQRGDALGDVYFDSTYKYELVAHGTGLLWHRTALSISW